MAELTRGVMFLIEDWPGYDDVRIAALNFELQDVLGDLPPGSPAYTERAKAFRREVSRRSRLTGPAAA
jgi:hypothetical protein